MLIWEDASLSSMMWKAVFVLTDSGGNKRRKRRTVKVCIASQRGAEEEGERGDSRGTARGERGVSSLT